MRIGSAGTNAAAAFWSTHGTSQRPYPSIYVIVIPPLLPFQKRSQATSMEHTTLYLIPLIVFSLSFLLSVARERSRRERPKKRARTTLYSWREIFSALPGQNIKSPTGSVTVFTNDYDARKWNCAIVYWRVNRSFFHSVRRSEFLHARCERSEILQRNLHSVRSLERFSLRGEQNARFRM